MTFLSPWKAHTFCDYNLASKSTSLSCFQWYLSSEDETFLISLRELWLLDWAACGLRGDQLIVVWVQFKVFSVKRVPIFITQLYLYQKTVENLCPSIECLLCHRKTSFLLIQSLGCPHKWPFEQAARCHANLDSNEPSLAFIEWDHNSIHGLSWFMVRAGWANRVGGSWRQSNLLNCKRRQLSSSGRLIWVVEPKMRGMLR